MALSSFTELDCWKNARELVRAVYVHFGKISDFAFRDQILRASLSITNNIAEGFGRSGFQERVQFMNIAIGSIVEVQSMLYLAIDLDYITGQTQKELFDIINRTLDKTRGFMKYLKQPKTKNK